jgi:choline dehydrogenase-like flavoprotein
MIIESKNLQDGSIIDCDVCIIGGGAAAIAMAMHFAGKRPNVSILESGSLRLTSEAQDLARGDRSGIPYFDLDETCYRLLGGSTIRWGARISPLKPIDFTERSWVPLSGWPICRADLDPYYERVFEFVGLHRPFTYEGRVWEPFNLSAPAFDGALFDFCAFQFGKNVLLGEIYRTALRDADNITVYLDATAQNIQSNLEGTRIEHIDVAGRSGRRFVMRARNHVLASGGIENARLLLLSNTVSPAGLCNENDLVGRYFMEHPTVLAGTIDSPRWQDLHDFFSPGLVSGHLVEFGASLSPALQKARKCLNAVVRTNLIVTHDATQALRELLWNLRYRRIPHQLEWYYPAFPR